MQLPWRRKGSGHPLWQREVEVRARKAFRLREEGSSRGRKPQEDSCNRRVSQGGIHQNLLDGPVGNSASKLIRELDDLTET